MDAYTAWLCWVMIASGLFGVILVLAVKLHEARCEAYMVNRAREELRGWLRARGQATDVHDEAHARVAARLNEAAEQLRQAGWLALTDSEEQVRLEHEATGWVFVIDADGGLSGYGRHDPDGDDYVSPNASPVRSSPPYCAACGEYVRDYRMGITNPAGFEVRLCSTCRSLLVADWLQGIVSDTGLRPEVFSAALLAGGDEG